jgi:hypothetical protein
MALSTIQTQARCAFLILMSPGVDTFIGELRPPLPLLGRSRMLLGAGRLSKDSLSYALPRVLLFSVGARPSSTLTICTKEARAFSSQSSSIQSACMKFSPWSVCVGFVFTALTMKAILVVVEAAMWQRFLTPLSYFVQEAGSPIGSLCSVTPRQRLHLPPTCTQRWVLSINSFLGSMNRAA